MSLAAAELPLHPPETTDAWPPMRLPPKFWTTLWTTGMAALRPGVWSLADHCVANISLVRSSAPISCLNLMTAF